MLRVLVWAHTGKGGWTGGHAAIVLDKRLEGEHLADGPTYISWWPNDDNSKSPFASRAGGPRTFADDLRNEMGAGTRTRLQDGEFTARRDRGQATVYESTSLGSLQVIPVESDLVDPNERALLDQAQFVQYPTVVVEIPTNEGNRTRPGLNIRGVLSWWLAFKNAYADPGYKYVSATRNCASVVQRALMAGEAAFYYRWSISGRPWGQSAIVTPAAVGRYAEQVRVGVEHHQRELPRFWHEKLAWQAANRRELIAMSQSHGFGEPELPSKKEWIRISNTNVKMSIVARRTGPTAAIDELIERYHTALPWECDEGADYRCEYLSEIFKQCGDYFAQKPRGDRTEAMIALANQVLLVLQLRAINLGSLGLKA